MKPSERGYGRFVLGLVLILGVAGSADQRPLSLGMVPLATLGMLIAAWGLSRMDGHASLRTFIQQLRARLPRTRRQRRKHIVFRAARR